MAGSRSCVVELGSYLRYLAPPARAPLTARRGARQVTSERVFAIAPFNKADRDAWIHQLNTVVKVRALALRHPPRARH